MLASYNSEVKYYRINANNTAIATSNNGVGTSAPTEEITAPVLGGTYVSGGLTAIITGAASGTQDFNDLAVNQYLYYINGTTGAYVLMGQIETIDSATQVTLYDTSLAEPTASASLVGSYFLITNTESLYMRVACSTIGAAPGTTWIPNFSRWRTSADVVNGVNNTSITNLERISNVGVPVSTASPADNVSFTIQTMNVFINGGSVDSNRFWANVGLLPQYMWIKITPKTTNNSLASKTMYRFTTLETFEGYQAGINTTVSQMTTLGYNVQSPQSTPQSQTNSQPIN
jgi:hypothetical protein